MNNQLSGYIITIILIIAIFSVAGATTWVVFSRWEDDKASPLSLTKPKQEVEYHCAYTDLDLCNFLAIITYRDPYFLANEPGTAIFTAGDHREETIIETDGTNIRLTSRRTGHDTRYVIEIGDTIYFKTDSDPVWQTRPVSPDIVLSPSVMNEYLERLKLISAYTKVGEEACGEKTCFIYQAEELVIYFDAENYLLRRLVVPDNGATMEHLPEYSYTEINRPI